MGQSVWHRHDIENILRGVEMAGLQTAIQAGDPDLEGFRRGFTAALAATAASFGIRVQDVRAYAGPSARVSPWLVESGPER